MRIDQRGRICLPVNLREKLNLELGDFVALSFDKEQITAKPSIQKGSLISKNVFEL